MDDKWGFISSCGPRKVLDLFHIVEFPQQSHDFLSRIFPKAASIAGEYLSMHFNCGRIPIDALQFLRAAELHPEAAEEKLEVGDHSRYLF
jgi:hypothetical protein